MPVATPSPAVGPSADRHATVSSFLPRLVAAAACVLVIALSTRPAHALATSVTIGNEAPPAPETATPPPKPDEYDRFRIGAMAGVGFPRPISFEAMTRLGGYVAVGAEYGLLPSISIDSVSTSAWAATLDLRIFPFRGAFFFAVRGGYQHISASASVSVAGASDSASASLDTWFMNPRLGFLWTWSVGFSIAIEAGVQLPLGSSFSSNLPTEVAMQVRTSTPVTVLSGVLPTVDLLRVGMLF